MAPPSLGIVCFRRHFRGVASDARDADLRNAALVAAVEASGHGLVSSTVLRGRYALRMCVMNHTTTAADVERVMDLFEYGEPEALSPAAAAVTYRRDREIRAHAAAPPGRAGRRRRRGAPTLLVAPAAVRARSTTTGARASRGWRAWRRAPPARRSSSSGTRRWTSTSSSTETSRC